MHEMAHSAVARHYGIKVRKIVHYPIGGVSEIKEIDNRSNVKWRVAVAGPLTSFVIGGFLFVLERIFLVAVPVTSIAPSLSTAGRLALDLASLNVLLGAFNLIPAFPMDGGRVFRALLAEHMRFSDATKYAAFLGRLMGIVMAVLVFVYNLNLWLVLIGLFVYIGATEEAELTIVSTTLARVRDVMLTEVVTVKPESTVGEALDVMFRARVHDALVERNGELEGIVT
jgi:Zn-dependent protease